MPASDAHRATCACVRGALFVYRSACGRGGRLVADTDDNLRVGNSESMSANIGPPNGTGPARATGSPGLTDIMARPQRETSREKKGTPQLTTLLAKLTPASL